MVQNILYMNAFWRHIKSNKIMHLCNILLLQCSVTTQSLQAWHTEEKPPGCFLLQCLCSKDIKGESTLSTVSICKENESWLEMESKHFCSVIFLKNDFVLVSVTCAPCWDPPGRPELYRFADSIIVTSVWSVCTAAPPDIPPAVRKSKAFDAVLITCTSCNLSDGQIQFTFLKNHSYL